MSKEMEVRAGLMSRPAGVLYRLVRGDKAEGDIMLWQAGLGPRPGNVIICGEKEIRDGRGPGGGK